MTERISALEWDNARLRGMLDVENAINELIAERVEEALKAYDATRNSEPEPKMENEQQDDNVEANADNNNGNGNGNPNVNNGGVASKLMSDGLLPRNEIQQNGDRIVKVKTLNCSKSYTIENNVERKGYAGVFAPYFKQECKMHHKRAMYGLVGNQMRFTCYGMETRIIEVSVPKLRSPTLQNKQNKNKNRNNESKTRAMPLVEEELNPNSNIITGLFLLNNHYATHVMLIADADRSFVSSTF
ncbi:hypothetical protein Tco_0561577 [Tanacetum coccineum]